MKTGAIILAAGTSSISKTEILMAELDTLREAEISPIVVVTGYEEEEIRKKLAHRKVLFISNPAYETTKMFDSLCLGLRELTGKCAKTLIVNGDTPSFSAETLRRITDLEQDVVFPSYKGMTGHPFCLDMRKAEEVLAYQGKDGIRGMIRGDLLDPGLVAVEDPGVLMEADGEESLREVLKYQRQGVEAHPVQAMVAFSLARKESFFDEKLASLLEEIESCGSMNMACKTLGMAYSSGWKMTRTAEEMLGFALITKKTGGAQGGGSVLTDKGKACLCTYRKIQRKLEAVAEEALDSFPV